MHRRLAGSARVSERVARQLPARAVVFLRAVGTQAPIRAAMAAGGYRPEDHDEGLSLLSSVCSYGSDGLAPEVDLAVREAARELADWARTHWARLRAALARMHPDVAPVFGELDVGDEARTLLAVVSLLDRLAALEASNPDALATLARRGFGPPERGRLGELVATAQRAEAPATTGDPRRVSADRDAAALADLYGWFQDWSATAKVFVKRKDWLMQLGLAKRGAGE